MTARTARFNDIPVIDVQSLIDPDAGAEDRQRTADEIRVACTHVGFFYIENHGIPAAHRDEVLDAMKRFFELPLAEKMKLHIGKAAQFRGYVPLAQEVTNQKKDWHECLDIQPLARAHSAPAQTATTVQAGGAHPLDDPGQWPEALPHFPGVIMRTWDQMMKLSEKLTEGLALSLGLEAGYFIPFTGSEFCDLRLAHYPPYEPAQGAGEIDAGMGAHCDNGFLTVLAQDEVGGLEVKNAAGQWISAPYIPETFLVNIGLMMQRWTNDRYTATLHRVQLPKAWSRSRYSMPFFYEPSYDAVIEPLAVCCDEDHPPRYEPCHFGTYVTEKFSRAYQV